jgi:hypothetical protein
MRFNRKSADLMASRVNMWDTSRKASQAEPTLKTANLDSKQRKHQNLQSSVFGGGYIDNKPISVDNSNKKITFGSTVNWKNQATLQQPDNSNQTQLTAYKMRQ